MSLSLKKPDDNTPTPSSPEVKLKPYVPSEKDILAITWIGKSFSCAVQRKGKLVSEALCRLNCTSVDILGEYLQESIQEVDFKGKTAALLIDGNILETSNITLPPASIRQQNAYTKEKVRRIEEDSGPLVWEGQRIAETKAGQKVLLHGISKTNFNRLNTEFVKCGLSLKKVLPFLGLATIPFKDVQTQPDSASIVLAPAGWDYKILSIDDKGDLQFARDLNNENRRDAQRAAIEINRCLLFARQQFGKPITQIILVGSEAERFEAGIKEVLQGEIPIVLVPSDDALWQQQLINANSYNLAKESMIQDRRRHWHQSIAASIFILFSLALSGYTIKSEFDWSNTHNRLALLSSNEDQMLEELAAIEDRKAEIQNHMDFIRKAQRLGRAPVERALISFLSTKLPVDTWVVDLETDWDGNSSSWNVRITLQCQTNSQIAQTRKQFVNTALQESAFGMNIAPVPHESLRQVVVQGNHSSLQTFKIEGTINKEGSNEA